MQSINKKLIQSIYKPRAEEAHKGTFGHVLIAAGSRGKIGAAVLATKACMRSGAGLVTAFIPKCGYDILQTSVPEAMVLESTSENHLSGKIDVNVFSVVGMGCGIGKHKQTAELLKHILSTCKMPLVLDADALNILSENKTWLKKLPKNSILTPHPKEFERLFGKTKNRQEAIQLQQQKAKELKCIIVLKGASTTIATPKNVFINTTGNSGMASAGMGDVLTGIITGIVAQGYTTEQAAIMGVYLHGLAGDLSVEKLSQEGLIASDVIDHLPLTFREMFY
jgi:ADP-dependent NAD(P)H-hydrate dehydratase / NAD(P)H-hydrate epimerase